VVGVDFKDLRDHPSMRDVEFHCGVFYEQDLGVDRIVMVTVWVCRERDYDPLAALNRARRVVRPGGRLVIEVPRLDSVTFRLFKERWPGLQAPQHTALYDRKSLLDMVARAGFEVVDYLPYGAFPAYFYIFAGIAFKILRGKGLDTSRAIYPYFLGQILLAPLLLFEKRLNLAMQTVICRRIR
jgi:SAM-dependent methyltransferase